MKRLLLAVAFAAAAAPLAAQTASQATGALIDRIVAPRTPNSVYVLPFGQYFHRYDHVVTDGAIEHTPEYALANQYSRCYECLPPTSSKDLVDEVKKPGLSRYYKAYLVDRKAPSDQVPPGTLPRSEPVRVPTPGVPRL